MSSSSSMARPLCVTMGGSLGPLGLLTTVTRHVDHQIRVIVTIGQEISQGILRPGVRRASTGQKRCQLPAVRELSLRPLVYRSEKSVLPRPPRRRRSPNTVIITHERGLLP